MSLKQASDLQVKAVALCETKNSTDFLVARQSCAQPHNSSMWKVTRGGLGKKIISRLSVNEAENNARENQ